MVAAVVGVVAAAGAAYSANKQSGAAKKAANAQSQAAADANSTQLQMFNQSRQDQAPFRSAGLVGLNQYMNLLGLGGNDQPTYGGGTASSDPMGTGNRAFVEYSNGIPVSNQAFYASDPLYKKAWDQAAQEHQAKYGVGYRGDSNGDNIAIRVGSLYNSFGGGKTGSVGHEKATPANMGGSNPAQAQQDAFALFRNTPGYQFGLDEGAKTVQASAAARGGLNSGATLKALTKFGNDYADQQGFTPYMNRLAALSGMAQTSANTTGQLGANYANQVGANLQNAGQARAQGIYGSANAWANGASQVAGAAGQYLGSQNSWSSNINNPNSSNYIPEIPNSGQYAPPEISF